MPEQGGPKGRHRCGEENLGATREAYQQAGCDADIEPFIGDMAAAYGVADLVLCRAGALTVSELCVAGLGAILVPFPHAVDDHQAHNAGRMVSEGAALMVRQPELTPQALAEILTELSRSKARELAVAARRLARPDAPGRVVT